jgi:TolB-like protein
VLPVANLSNDPGPDYFIDGITDDLTTRLMPPAAAVYLGW